MNKKELDSIVGKSEQRRIVLQLIAGSRRTGVTWREVSEEISEHHGTVTGVLSNLHEKGHIARLSEKRNGSRIYVLPKYVGKRDVEKYNSRKKKIVTCPHCQGTFASA